MGLTNGSNNKSKRRPTRFLDMNKQKKLFNEGYGQWKEMQ
jgi:hypothetical protein